MFEKEINAFCPLPKNKQTVLPVMSKSPNLDCFVPPKANGSLGTGTPMLTPIIPQNKDLVKKKTSKTSWEEQKT